MALQHLRSNTANKRPDPTAMADGQLAINTPAVSPGLFFKDAAGVLVKVGPVHVGTTAPNASPASGGTAGNSVGEQWLDTTGGTYVFKVWDGSAWRSESGTFVDVNGDTMTGALGIIAGSAGSPGLYFSGDTNTGIYSPGADQVAISTNGAGRLSIGSNGLVQVGTTTFPTTIGTRLVVRNEIGVSDGEYEYLTLAGAVPSVTAQGAYSNLSVGANGTSGNLIFRAGNQERARITSAGLVGVGTTAPNSKLYVVAAPGASSFDGITLNNGVKDALGLYTTGASYSYGSVGGNQSWIYCNHGDLNIASDDTGVIKFSGDVGVERMRLDASGRLGIGTSSPSAKFVVSNNGANGLEFFPELYADTNTIASFNRSTSSYKSLRFECSDYAFLTGATTAVSINSSGRVGIGTTSAGSRLEVGGESQPRIGINSTGAGTTGVLFQGAGTTYGSIVENITTGELSIKSGASGQNSYFITFGTNDGSEKARLTSSGQLLVGTSSAPSAGGGQFDLLVVQGNTTGSTGHGSISLQRGETAANITANEDIGYIKFNDSAGNSFAHIACTADANAGTNDYPGRLTFSTTADGASSPTERMRITNVGDCRFGTTSSNPVIDNVTGVIIGANAGGNLVGYVGVSRMGGPPMGVNRGTDDGNLIEFLQAGVQEGTISVSGTTISYNGAHLSRWSQLPSGAERTEILRGSVLSNLDEMCEWSEEGNEQLNRMKVSDVEGDKNVSGVFQAWDDDDDTYTNDFYCAMTGDFIVRIAEGVTVERGDLLMSAGDGTAKPQDDDIIRSKTIAKVTSTNVSCTYADGSYCVPCVLMAC